MDKTIEQKVRESLRGADLSGANLRGADLRMAALSRANLYGADLRGADLRMADLSRANLGGAYLSGAGLSGANLYGANLRGAALSRANLYRADLRGADLRSAKLLGAILPEGVTFEKFRDEVVPDFLTARRKGLSGFRDPWTCHNWMNCPTAHAFDADGIENVPAAWRVWAERFIQLFDAELLPWEEMPWNREKIYNVH